MSGTIIPFENCDIQEVNFILLDLARRANFETSTPIRQTIAKQTLAFARFRHSNAPGLLLPYTETHSALTHPCLEIAPSADIVDKDCAIKWSTDHISQKLLKT